jgi:hypothetical protein
VKPVRIVAKNPEIDITIPMGEGPAYLTGGLGGWVPVELVDGIDGVDWEGQEGLTEDVPLLLNGLERGESVQREWNTVKKLGRDANGDEARSPVFRVWGPVEYPGKAWVLPKDGITINEEEIHKRRSDGELLRIEFTLHLLEYIAPEAIQERRRQKRKVGLADNVAVGGAYTTKKGDTLQTIAADIFDDWRQWRRLAAKNPVKDPNRKLPAGMKLRV